MSKSIFSFSSNNNHYAKLYTIAAIMENIGYNTLVPIDVKSILADANIHQEKLHSRNDMSLDEMNVERIKLADGLIVYVNGNDDELLNYGTCIDIIEALNRNMDLYINCEDVSIQDVSKFIKQKTSNTIKGIIPIGQKIVNLNGGYSIILTKVQQVI